MRNRLLLLGLTSAVALLLAAPALADHDGDAVGDDTETATVTADVGALAGSRTIASVAGGAHDVTLPALSSLDLNNLSLDGGGLVENSVTLLQHPTEPTTMHGALAVLVHENLAARINEWHVTLKSTDLTFTQNPGGEEVVHTLDNDDLTANAPTVTRLNALAGLSVTEGTQADLSAERLIYSVSGSANPLLLDLDVYASLQTIELELPVGVIAGEYTGTFTVSLYE